MQSCTCSNLVMINKETRRLSRIPYQVQAELEKYFVDTPPIIKEITTKFPELEKNDVYVRNDLTVSRVLYIVETYYSKVEFLKRLK